MDIKFEKGFILMKDGKGPVYISLHSGPTFGGRGKTRDTDSDKIASLCWRRTGGYLLFSNTPREQIFGIDLNRDLPDEKTAIIASKEKETQKYINKYGFVAYDKKDYQERSFVYKNFWNTAKNLGDQFFLLHTLDVRLANFPSVVDIITFDYKGVSKNIIEKIIKELNCKYKDFFSEISKNYKKRILFEHIMRMENTISKDKIPVRQENFEREMNVIRNFSSKDAIKELEKKLNEKTFINAVSSALENGGEPRITIEYRFSGKKAFAPRNYLLGKDIVLEIEINNFLGQYFPKQTTDIIIDIINSINNTDNK